MHRGFFLFSSLLLAGAAVLPTGCKRPEATSAPAEPAKTAAAAPVKPQPLSAEDYARLRPNELGFIPVIMYHEIGGKPAPRDPGLVRSVEAFRKDLELMHAKGFYPVNMADVLDHKLDVPAGKTPIVLTFDDARASQFQLIETADAMKIDPNSGVGIMDAMHKKHGDEWPMRATFFVLPPSSRTVEPFGQPGLGAQKFAYILEQGMELANHSVNHQNMSRMTPAQLQAEIGGAHNAILEMAPDAKISVIALPMGKYPNNKAHWKYLTQGEFGGKSYNYKGAMRAAYRAVPSPLSKRFDPMEMERIGPADVRWGVRWWLDELKRGSSEYPRYVSDGIPDLVSVPKGMDALINQAALKETGKTIEVYSPFGGSGGAKPIVGSESGKAKPITGAEPTAPAAPSAPKPIQGL